MLSEYRLLVAGQEAEDARLLANRADQVHDVEVNANLVAIRLLVAGLPMDRCRRVQVIEAMRSRRWSMGETA